MMKKSLLIVMACFAFLSTYAQAVVASGGQSGSSNELQASATVGEAIIGANTNGSEFANQGFQQPLKRDITSVIETSSKLRIDVTVGPVPTRDYIEVTLQKSFEGMLVLTDQQGRLINRLNVQRQSQKYQLQLMQLKSGTYFVSIYSPEGKVLTSIPVIKI